MRNEGDRADLFDQYPAVKKLYSPKTPSLLYPCPRAVAFHHPIEHNDLVS